VGFHELIFFVTLAPAGRDASDLGIGLRAIGFRQLSEEGPKTRPHSTHNLRSWSNRVIYCGEQLRVPVRGDFRSGLPSKE